MKTGKKNSKIDIICQECNTPFLAYKTAVEKRNKKFCSTACLYKGRVVTGTGGRKKSTEPLSDRFWRQVLKTDSCWLWQGGITYGYGSIMIGRKSIKAHRLSYTLTCGEIPDGLVVCHKCDVRNCVNPEHLFLGTQKDNMQDMIAKGRRVKRNQKIKIAA